jgi:hypothetical protein
MADLWTFPDGMVGHSDSVKGYRVLCTDEPVGAVVWADYKPGESYLVVEAEKARNHVVPAGAVAAVDHGAQTVTLTVSAADVRATPAHEDSEMIFDDSPRNYVDQFARGMLGGGYVWPYTDV